ncbi:MAG: transglutaminase-like cysteine peptidase [Pseudolabrys sp.]|nr:transglutaminase-like cysteine peptidase [Pseudolabrys sp.]
MCRAAASGCPAAAAKFIAVVDAGRKLQGRARIGEINRAVNLAIRPASDLAQYGVIELWASPLTTFASGAGDCEDYAIAKYVALREAGVPERDLRLLVVRLGNDDHAVVSARVDGEWLILDNRNMRLLTEADSGLEALYALGGAPNSVPSMTEAPATAAAPGLDWPQSFAVELSV